MMQPDLSLTPISDVHKRVNIAQNPQDIPSPISSSTKHNMFITHPNTQKKKKKKKRRNQPINQSSRNEEHRRRRKKKRKSSNESLRYERRYRALDRAIGVHHILERGTKHLVVYSHPEIVQSQLGFAHTVSNCLSSRFAEHSSPHRDPNASPPLFRVIGDTEAEHIVPQYVESDQISTPTHTTSIQKHPITPTRRKNYFSRKN